MVVNEYWKETEIKTDQEHDPDLWCLLDCKRAEQKVNWMKKGQLGKIWPLPLAVKDHIERNGNHCYLSLLFIHCWFICEIVLRFGIIGLNISKLGCGLSILNCRIVETSSMSSSEKTESKFQYAVTSRKMKRTFREEHLLRDGKDSRIVQCSERQYW